MVQIKLEHYLTPSISGYEIDMLLQIANNLNWDLSNVSIICMSESNIKSKLQSNDILMGLGSLIIDYESLDAGLIYSLPTYASGLKVLLYHSNLQSLWKFFDPFDVALWIVILFTAIFTGIVTWLFED